MGRFIYPRRKRRGN